MAYSGEIPTSNHNFSANVVMPNPIEAFNDALVELEQYRQATGISKSEVMEQPDCADVFGSIVQLVSRESCIALLYSETIRQYRRNKPDRICSAIGAIGTRLIMMEDLDLISSQTYERLSTELKTGDLARREAITFFRVFRGVLDPSVVIPKEPRKAKRKPRLIIEKAPEAPVEILLSPLEETRQYLEDNKERKGIDYDLLNMMYADHRHNNLKTRYTRDFKGYKGHMPKDIYMPKSEDRNGKGIEWFTAHMNRFPLLDGLAHEKELKDKIELGKDAMLRILHEDLSQQEKDRLEIDAIEGAGAFSTMYECNLRLVVTVAHKKSTSSSFDLSDAIQYGCMGLRRAIQKYDPKKGFKFSTYATKWINQSIDRGRAEIFHNLHLPPHAETAAKEVLKMMIRAEEDNKKLPNDKELIKMGYKEHIINAARNIYGSQRFSLDRPLSNEGDESYYNVLPGVEENYDENFELRDGISFLAKLVAEADIDERSQLFLSLRNGLILPGVDYSQPIKLNGHGVDTIGKIVYNIRSGATPPPTLDVLAETMNLTRERIRQVTKVAEISLMSIIALNAVAERLLLDEEEKEKFVKYISFDKNNKSHNLKKYESLQKDGKYVISTLGLMDTDMKTYIEETIDVLKVEYERTELITDRMRQWLEVRFGVKEHEDGIPVRSRESMSYFKLDTVEAKLGEAVLLSIIGGTAGKLPSEFGIKTD